MENMVSEAKKKEAIFNPDFFANKKILITGHTGFKGSWLSFILCRLGANVVGYSLEPPTTPSLYKIAKIESDVESHIGDIRDFDALLKVVRTANPDVVFHLAAQPLVLDGYKKPRYTYETNVMGTVNILEACRRVDNISSIVNVTTDKVYLNEEREGYGYREDDALDGHDPYSNSKSCSELVTHSYSKSFFQENGVPVSTARAGNVIGGGDFANNRIIPDCVRAAVSKEPLIIRNPNSTRPYQHVLEPLLAYLIIASKQAQNALLASSYNVGPDDCDCVTTGELVDIFSQVWGSGFSWVDASNDPNAPHEANFLKLDSSKIKKTFNWSPVWHIDNAVEKVIEWSREYLSDKDVRLVMESQINDYLNQLE